MLKEIGVVSFLLSEDLNSSNEWVFKTAPSAAAKRKTKQRKTKTFSRILVIQEF